MQTKFRRSSALAILPAAVALAIGTFSAAAAAADVTLSGAVSTGLHYSKAEGADHGNLKLAGQGELPDDPFIMITANEKLDNGWYTGAQLKSRFYADTGSLSNSSVLFDAQARVFAGNDKFEVSFGRLGGLTVAGLPYSVYAKVNANMCFASLGGIAPANITFQPGDLTNAIGFTTNGDGFFLRGVYSNGSLDKSNKDTENTEDWSDRRHVAQIGTGWTGERFKAGIVYSWEMPGQLQNANGTRDMRRKATHAVHLIASYDFGGPAISGILYASKNEWRIGPVDDLVKVVGDGRIAASEEGLDNYALYMSARYPIGQHVICGAAGFLKSKWNGAETQTKEDEGTLTMAGLMYYYNFSKRTNFYAATSIMDGKKMLDAKDATRLNTVMATAGITHRF